MRRSDPRIRQTLNQISSTLETANLNTQASIFSFSEAYVQPCLFQINTCLEASCYPCIGAQRDFDRRRHRNRGGRNTNRGRPELSFDFYDDWDEGEGEGAGLLGGWGNDELDRLLAGSGAGQSSESQQPRKHRAMSYGSRGIRKKMAQPTKDGDEDTTTIPTSSVFGFLERVPWIGGRGVRYKPSAADLQENPGGRKRQDEDEPLISEDSEGERTNERQGRPRSSTNASHSTNNSLSSRGDLFPSDDEDDAVPLDDEFAMVLGSRMMRTTSGDQVSGGGHSKQPSTRKKRPSASQASTRTVSSKDTNTKSPRRVKTPDGLQMAEALPIDEGVEITERGLPSMEELQEEEERVRAEEEGEVERKREAAYRLALERGLLTGDSQVLMSPTSEATNTPEPPSMDSSFILQRPPSTRDPSQTQEGEKPPDPPDPTISSQRPSDQNGDTEEDHA